MGLNTSSYQEVTPRKSNSGVQVIAVARLHEALTEAMQLSDELT